MNTTRFAIRIESMDDTGRPTVRFLCRGRSGLFTSSMDAADLIEGELLATYSSPARANAAYVPYMLKYGDGGDTARFGAVAVDGLTE